MKIVIDYIINILWDLFGNLTILIIVGTTLFSFAVILIKIITFIKPNDKREKSPFYIKISLSKIKWLIKTSVFVIPIACIGAISFKLLDAWDQFGIYYNLYLTCFSLLLIFLCFGILIGLSYWHCISWKSWIIFCLSVIFIIPLYLYPQQSQLNQIALKRFNKDKSQYMDFIYKIKTDKVKPVKYYYPVPPAFPAVEILELYSPDSSLAIAFYKCGNNAGAPGWRGYVYMENDQLDVTISFSSRNKFRINEHWYWEY